jgi:dTDP-4-dehydrorhamnose reductase
VGTGREVDIADAAAVASLIAEHAPTHVFNCAAYTDVDGAEDDEPAAFRANALGPEVLGRAATARGFRIVHYSTDYVFPGTRPAFYREDDPPAPVNAYGRSKLDGERRFLAACPTGLVVRSSWLFGDGGPNFVDAMLLRMAEREEVSVVDDQHGRPTHALDLAEASLALAGIGPDPAEARPRGVAHFANVGVATWHGLAVAIHQAARRRGLPLKTRRVLPVATHEFPRRAARPPRAVLDTTRTESLLARPTRTWGAALEHHLDRQTGGPP